MAYTFFPKSISEIAKELENKNFPKENIQEVVSLYTLLSDKLEQPINIDLTKKTNVNVSRSLEGDMTIPDIKRKAGLKKIKIKFNDNAGSLYQKMILVGLPLLVEAIKEIMKKNYIIFK